MSVLLKTGTGLFGASRVSREDDIFLHRLNVACLPEVDEAADGIIALIEELNTADITPVDRHARFHALARYCVLEIETALDSDSHQHMALDVEANIALTAIFRIVDTLVLCIWKATAAVDKKTQASSIYTQYELLLATVVLYSECRRRLPQGFWHRVHELYRLSEHLRITRFRCREQHAIGRNFYYTTPSTAQLYMMIVIMGNTNMAHLSLCTAVQLRKLLSVIVDSIKIKRHSPRRAQKDDYLQIIVDVQQDAPVLGFNCEVPADDHLRCLDMQALKRKMKNALKRANVFGQPGEHYWEQITDSLLTIWSAKPERSLERLAVNQPLELLVGWRDTVALLHTRMSDTTDTTCVVPQSSDSASACDIDTSTAMDLSMDLRGNSDNGIIPGSALDSSLSGLRIRCPVDRVQHIDIGELIAWREVSHDDSASHTWQAGILRWVTNLDGYQIDLGVALITGEPTATVLVWPELPDNHTPVTASVRHRCDALLVLTSHGVDATKGVLLTTLHETCPPPDTHVTAGDRQYKICQIIDEETTAIVRLQTCILTPLPQ